MVFVTADMPAEVRRETLQAAVVLLPDEHREALQTLLYFLSDIASHSSTNQVQHILKYIKTKLL